MTLNKDKPNFICFYIDFIDFFYFVGRNSIFGLRKCQVPVTLETKIIMLRQMVENIDS